MTTDLLQTAIRARNGLWAVFFFMGVVSMAWVARIPEIRDANGLNNGQLGLILLSSTIGAVIGAQLAGRLIHTYGTKPVVRVASIIMPIGLVFMGASTSPLTLIVGLFVMGLGYSSMDIASNTQAVAIENLLGKRVMSSFHALWSSGAFVTTVLGGAIAKHVSPRDNLVGVGIMNLLPPHLDDHNGGEEDTQAKIPLFGKSVLPLWGMGIGLLGGLIAEGAASDWGAILLRDDMGFGKGVNASAFATFSLAMITSRFLGDRALDYFGPRKTVQLGGYLGSLGLALGISIGVPLSNCQYRLCICGLRNWSNVSSLHFGGLSDSRRGIFCSNCSRRSNWISWLFHWPIINGCNRPIDVATNRYVLSNLDVTSCRISISCD